MGRKIGRKASKRMQKLRLWNMDAPIIALRAVFTRRERKAIKQWKVLGKK